MSLQQQRFSQSPATWDRRRLKHHLSGFFGGGTPSKDNESFWTGGSIPWVSPKDMKTRLIVSSEDSITPEAVAQSATSMVPVNSVLMVVRSGILKHTLPVAINSVPVALNQDMKAFRFRKSLSERFFAYWIEGQSKALLLEWGQIGATVDNIDVDTMLNSKISLPNVEAQKKIANFLDRETARIDELIEKKERFLEKADEQWKAMLNHQIFPGSPDWSKLPPGWRKVQLKYLSDEARPIMYGIVLPGPNMEEGPMIVKGGDVKPGRLSPEKLCRTTVEIEASYKRSRLKEGDLVISIRGGIGDIESVPMEIEGANLTQDAARVAPASGVNAVWLRYALLSPAVFHPLDAKSLGAAVRGINIFDLKRVCVPTPQPEQQSPIAQGLAEHEMRLSALRSAVIAHTDRLREYRAALITAAVTGQIDVSIYGKKGATSATLDQIEVDMQA